MYTMNAHEYNEKVMKGAFKKIYPEIARQIIERTKTTEGVCIDLGGGPGMLGIWLAKLSQLKVIVYDMMPECVELVAENSIANGVSGKVSARQGKAEQMNFADNSVDLVVSRGSIFFWEDQKKGLAEIYRILKPGGWAYVGGGFGNKEILDEILKAKAEDKEWLEKRKKRMGKQLSFNFQAMLDGLHIQGKVEQSEVGNWIIFRK